MGDRKKVVVQLPPRALSQSVEERYALEDTQQLAHFGELEGWTLRESQGDRALQQVYAEIEGTLPGVAR